MSFYFELGFHLPVLEDKLISLQVSRLCVRSTVYIYIKYMCVCVCERLRKRDGGGKDCGGMRECRVRARGQTRSFSRRMKN